MGNETKIFQPGGELPEFIFDYEGFQENLIPEWQTVVERLQQTDRGREALNDDKLRELINTNSTKITDVENIVSDPSISPTTFSYGELRNMYYAFTPLISTRGKSHVFDFISQGLTPEVEEYKSEGKLADAMIKQRMLANIFEEQSIIDPERSELHTIMAISLNTEIAECDSSILDIPYSPRKLHARFSLFDIYFRGARDDLVTGKGDPAEIILKLEKKKSESDAYLADAFDRSLKADHHKVAIGGSVAELGLLSAARKRIISLGECGISKYGASQGFLRQDEGDKTGLPEDRRPRWLWGHDLYFENYDLGKTQPVEVKKNTPGANYNGSPSSYLPLIDVSALTLGKGLGKFFKLGGMYFGAEAAGDDIESLVENEEDLRSVSIFTKRLDSELDRIFGKLDTRQEAATNYFDARRLKPTVGSFAQETTSNT